MMLVSKNELILHIYFVAKKKKNSVLFYIYNFYFENLIYKWIKQCWVRPISPFIDSFAPSFNTILYTYV